LKREQKLKPRLKLRLPLKLRLLSQFQLRKIDLIVNILSILNDLAFILLRFNDYEKVFYLISCRVDFKAISFSV